MRNQGYLLQPRPTNPGLVFSFSGLFPAQEPKNRTAFTLTEILIAFLVVALLLLPIFTSVGHAVAETERYYTEAFAMTHAKGIMDSLMFQIPFRCIHSDKDDKTCLLRDPENKVTGLLRWSFERFFDLSTQDATKDKGIRYEGELRDRKGFIYKIRVKCVDVDDITFKVDGKTFTPSELTSKDGNGKYTVLKKLILEIRWSLIKNEDPLFARSPKKIFLVGFKCDVGT